jgi:hypothetical protein
MKTQQVHKYISQLVLIWQPTVETHLQEKIDILFIQDS